MISTSLQEKLMKQVSFLFFFSLIRVLSDHTVSFGFGAPSCMLVMVIRLVVGVIISAF